MKFFIDTANIDEIKKAHAVGMVDGVTTNPSLIAKEGKRLEEIIPMICDIVNGPISVEVLSETYDEMMKEAEIRAKIHKNVTVKLPMTLEGLKAVRTLSSKGIKTNVTLVFSPNQALLAARAGATFVSPFVGRLDDISHIGMEVVGQILEIYSNYDYTTEVLVASVRNPIHIIDAARMGAHVATMPYTVIEQLVKHPLTDIGIERFKNDWKKVPK